MKILASLLVKHLVKKAKKSATIAVATVGMGAGAAIVLDPELLEAIPEEYRGYIFVGIGVVTLLARLRKEIAALIAEIKEK